MTERLPAVLTELDLPGPELRAAALDGQVYPVGDAWRSVAEIDDSDGRAIAAGRALGSGVVLAEGTAAWVWGAPGAAPRPHTGFVPSPARVKHQERGSVVRQVVIDEDEIVLLQGVAVTSPARTVVDLVRDEAWTARHETMARDVSARHFVTRSAALELLDRRGRLPHRRRAAERLGRVCQPDDETTLKDEPAP